MKTKSILAPSEVTELRGRLIDSLTAAMASEVALERDRWARYVDFVHELAGADCECREGRHRCLACRAGGVIMDVITDR